MSTPELFGDLAAVFLARTWHRQPDPRTEGEPMTDDPTVEAEARRGHAADCRKFDPDVTDAQIAAYWEQIGEDARYWFRNAARLRLQQGATR